MLESKITNLVSSFKAGLTLNVDGRFIRAVCRNLLKKAQGKLREEHLLAVFWMLLNGAKVELNLRDLADL